MSLPEDIKSNIKRCVIIVICVSRGYKVNLACQRVARYAAERELKGAILLFALLQGDYTLSSVPEKVTGWLGFMLKGK